jgi:hypothetical protein
VVTDAGTVIFRGSATTDRRMFSANGPGYEITFQDALWDLQFVTFQQTWKWRVNGTDMTTGYFSRLNLFQSYTTGDLQSTGAQIADIVQHAALCGVNIAVGTIDDLMPQPLYPVKAISCADAIRLCLRPVPDAQMWLDPSSNPPQLHCRQRANLASVSLPWKDGTTHESGEIIRRQDLEVPVVEIQYQKSFENNGKVYNQVDVRRHPVTESALQRNALVFPVDLRGGQRTDLTVSVEATDIDPSDLEWWKVKKPDLASDKYAGLAFATDFPVTIQDDDGNDVDMGALPNELVSGDVLTWMYDIDTNAPITAQQVTITGWFVYTELDEFGRAHRVVTDLEPHEISVRVKLTNSAVGVIPYSILQNFDPGESAPVGLETYLYTTLHPAQFQGAHTFRTHVDHAPAVGTIYGPWNKLNLSGGAAEWAAMDSAIQMVSVDIMHGQQTIEFGPPAHLSPDEIWTWLQNWSYRQVYDAGDLRISGEQQASSGALGGQQRSENTTQANPLPAIDSVQAEAVDDDTSAVVGTMRVKTDAENQTFKMEVVENNQAGAQVTAQGSVTMDLPTIRGKHAAFREVCVKVNGVSKTAWALMTEPE